MSTNSNHYVSITEEDMDKVLQSDKGWYKEENTWTHEIVYCYNLAKYPNYKVMVYSSIKKLNKTSKGCGKDAIRVCCINTNTNKGVIKNGRINRVPGWGERLKAKVINTIKEVNSMKNSYKK